MASIPARAAHPAGSLIPPSAQPAIWAAGLAIFALGGLWWGEVIAADPDRDRPVLSAALLLGAVLDFALGKLRLPGAISSYSALLWLAPVLFLWAATVPALASFAFPDGRGQSRGLFPATALLFAGLAAGLAGGQAPGALWPKLGPSLASELAMALAALIAWPWLRQKEALSNLKLWPSYTLGVFKGKVYGQDLSVSVRLSKTVVKACFLGAGAAAASFSPELFPRAIAPGAWPAPVAFLALGALGSILLGPLLALLASPVTALSMALMLLALSVGLGPGMAGESSPGGPLGPYLVAAPALVSLGAVWPLAARIQVAKTDLVAPAMGRLSLWLLLGLMAGLLCSAYAIEEGGSLGDGPALVAWAAAMLALAPTLGYFAAVVLWVAIAVAIRYL
jgi:hypothetical protein